MKKHFFQCFILVVTLALANSVMGSVHYDHQAQTRRAAEIQRSQMYSENQFARQPIIASKERGTLEKAELKSSQKLRPIQKFINRISARFQKFFYRIKSVFYQLLNFSPGVTKSASGAPTLTWEFSKINNADLPLVSFFISYADPDNDVTRIQLDFGDGSIIELTGDELTNPLYINHVYPWNDHYNAKIEIEDSLGNKSNYATYTELQDEPASKVTFTATADPEDLLNVAFEFKNTTNPYVTVCPTGSTNTSFFNCIFPSAGTYPLSMFYKDSGQNIIQFDTEITVGGATVTAKPVPYIKVDKIFGTAPLTINFDSENSFDIDGEIISYEWDFGDDYYGTNFLFSPKVQHTFNKPGVYYVSLKVKDNNGLENLVYKEIYVQNSETPVPQIIAFNHGGLAVSFEVSSFSVPTPVNENLMFWDFGDGTSYTGKNPYHVYSSAGTYTIHLKAIDITGQTFEADHEISITATDESPIAIASTDKYKVIPYEDVTYDGSSSSDPWSSDPLVYQWSFIDENVGDSDGVVLKNYDNVGMKNSALYVTNSKGFTSKSKVKNEVLSSLDVFDVVATWSPKVGIGATLVNFDGSKSKSKQGKIVSYMWAHDGKPIVMGAKGSYTFTTTGNNYFDFIITDAIGNQTSMYERVIIKSTTSPGNIPPVAVANISSVSSEGIVNYDCTSSTDADGEVAFCEWKLNGLLLGVHKNGSTKLKEKIDYVLELTVTDDWGATDTKYFHIDMQETNNGYFAFDYSPLKPLINQEITFGAEESVGAAKIVSYNWNFGDSTSGSGAIVKHAYTSAGTYTVTLTFTDENSNVFTKSQNVTVLTSPSVADVNVVARPYNLATAVKSTETFRSFNLTDTIRFEVASGAGGEGILHDTTWTFGDGKSGFGESVEYSYFKPGTYTVTAVTKTKSNSTITKSLTVIISDKRSCLRNNGSTMCLRFASTVNNIMPLSSANWTITNNLAVSYSTSTDDRPAGWITLVNADDRDQTPAIDISNAVTSVSGATITISREKVLEKNIDLSKPYMISVNTKSTTGAPLIGESIRFYFGGARLNIDVGEIGSIVEVVHTASLYRKYFNLSSVNDQLLTDMPSGDYTIVTTKAGKKSIVTAKVNPKENKLINVDLDSAVYFKKKTKKKAFALSSNKDNGDESQPSWTHSLCGEPSPFKTAEKKNLNSNEYFSHNFSSADPAAEIEYHSLTPHTPRPVTLSCGVTTPALLYGQNKWKYKDGPGRCDGNMKPHAYWNDYLKNLEREEKPIVIIYEIQDAWTGETVKGHYITSAKEIQLKKEMRLVDLTAKIGLGFNDDHDWAQRIEYILPVPVHFRRPQVRFELISEHNVSSEDFYSVECHIIEQKTKPMVARLGAYNFSVGSFHNKANNGRFSLEPQYNYFPLQYDGRSTGAVTTTAEAAHARYTVSINYHDYQWVQWQRVEVEFMYGDQSFVTTFNLEGIISNNLQERYTTNSFTIDTSVLAGKFYYVPGEKKMYLKITPIGKLVTDYDFRGEPKKFPFTPLFDLQTVALDYPTICSQGFYGTKVTTFVRDELIESIIHGVASNADLRCGDASTPFGGIFELNTTTLLYNGHRDGASINVRSLNEAGTHDEYDDFSVGTPLRKGDIYEYLNFSAATKTISEITSESEVRTATAKKKLFDFCHPTSGDPIAPCTAETTFTDLDHDMVLQICQWNMNAGVMPEGCPTVDTSKIIRFANWVGKNASAYSAWASKFPLSMMISDGRTSPLTGYAGLDWQKQALEFGLWPDGKPIWRVSEALDGLTDDRASTCHADREGCLALNPLFVDSAEFLNKMFLGTGWR